MNELSIGENEKQIQSTSPPSSTAKRTQSLRYLTQQPSASQPNMLINCIAETPIRGYRGCALPYWDGPKETAAFLVPAHIPGTRHQGKAKSSLHLDAFCSRSRGEQEYTSGEVLCHVFFSPSLTEFQKWSPQREFPFRSCSAAAAIREKCCAYSRDELGE